MRVLLVTFAVLSLLTACARDAEPRPEWVIRSRVVFLEEDLRKERKAPPSTEYRLWFPSVSGDFYGPSNIASFNDVTPGADHSFVLDLNAAVGRVEKSLQPTRFSIPSVWIGPAEARLARLTPFVLQADGIEPIGRAEWIDARTRHRLMLVYFDRQSRVVGHARTNGRMLHFDIIAQEPGYVWVSQEDTDGQSEWKAVQPAEVLLAVTPNEDLRRER